MSQSQRWVKNKGYVEVPDKVEKFMRALASLCARHGYSISYTCHEGAFLIDIYDEENMRWLMDAQVSDDFAAGVNLEP